MRRLPAFSKFTVMRLPMTLCTWPKPQSGRSGWRTKQPGKTAPDMVNTLACERVNVSFKSLNTLLRVRLYHPGRKDVAVMEHTMNQPILNMGAGRTHPVGFDIRVVHLLHSRVLHDLAGPVGA